MVVPSLSVWQIITWDRSQSALLNKVGRLFAEQHLILKHPKIPNATAFMAWEQVRLTKRIRTRPTPSAVGVSPTLDEDQTEGMVEGPLENMLWKLIKGTTSKRKTILIKPATPSTSRTVPKKKHLLPQTPTIQKKLTPSFTNPHAEERIDHNHVGWRNGIWRPELYRQRGRRTVLTLGMKLLPLWETEQIEGD